MNVEEHSADDGVVAQWFVAGDTLHIYLADDLDEVTRQRYITEAKTWANIPDQRRYRRIPLLLPVGQMGHLRSAMAKHPAAASAGVIAAAVSITAAVTLPAVLDGDNGNMIHRRPPAAAAPPTVGPNEPVTPDRPQPRSTTRSEAARPRPRARGTTVKKRLLPAGSTIGPISGQTAKIPPVALPLPTPRPSSPALKVDVPPLAKATVGISSQLKIRIRLRAGQR